MEKKGNLISNIRNNKTWRMGIIGGLIIIILLLIVFWKKATTWLWVLVIILLIAFSIEGFDYDIDLKKFIETGSYQESRVETIEDSDGNSYRVITGTCLTKDFDLNCKDFSTQDEAQAKYNQCAKQIQKDNPDITNINKFDIYGLDGNNNGIVCEALPKLAQ